MGGIVSNQWWFLISFYFRIHKRKKKKKLQKKRRVKYIAVPSPTIQPNDYTLTCPHLQTGIHACMYMRTHAHTHTHTYTHTHSIHEGNHTYRLSLLLMQTQKYLYDSILTEPNRWRHRYVSAVGFMPICSSFHSISWKKLNMKNSPWI